MLRNGICLFLVLTSLLCLTACTSQASAVPETADPASNISAAETLPPETAPAVPVTEPPATVPPEGFLYLSVSRLTFTLTGESEDVYLGTVPREDVTWGTEDPAVATFDGGILTATGVGETTAWAEFADQRIECTVGCLARTEEELAQLDRKIIRSAKRYPPNASETASSFFDNAAMVGDSITYATFRWHTLNKGLGNVQFLCQGGSSVKGYNVRVNKPFYQGQQMPLEDALAAAGITKAFIMLGQNDMGYQTIEEVIEQWGIMVSRIREKCPDIELYIQSCIPEWKEDNQPNTSNERLDEYNIALRAFAEENGCHFIDLGAYAEDHANKMPAEYNLDSDIHMNEAGSNMWMQLLRGYSEYQALLGGQS